MRPPLNAVCGQLMYCRVHDPRVREISLAINRQEITTFYPPGAEVMTQFVPPSLWGHNLTFRA